MNYKKDVKWTLAEGLLAKGEFKFTKEDYEIAKDITTQVVGFIERNSAKKAKPKKISKFEKMVNNFCDWLGNLTVIIFYISLLIYILFNFMNPSFILRYEFELG